MLPNRCKLSGATESDDMDDTAIFFSLFYFCFYVRRGGKSAVRPRDDYIYTFLGLSALRGAVKLLGWSCLMDASHRKTKFNSRTFVSDTHAHNLFCIATGRI